MGEHFVPPRPAANAATAVVAACFTPHKFAFPFLDRQFNGAAGGFHLDFLIQKVLKSRNIAFGNNLEATARKNPVKSRIFSEIVR